MDMSKNAASIDLANNTLRVPARAEPEWAGDELRALERLSAAVDIGGTVAPAMAHPGLRSRPGGAGS